MSEALDKQQLYGRYQRSEDDRHALAMKMAHKALDIPEGDDLKITNANRTTNGLDWKGLTIIVAALLGLGYYAMQQQRPPQQPPPAAPPASLTTPADSARIRVYWGDEEIKPGESRTAEVGP